MEVEVVRFSEEHLPVIEEFSRATWERPRTRSFYDWRYLACQRFHRQFLALTGSECQAVVSAFCKPYLMGGTVGPCLEVFDWYCRPGLKGGGIGGKVMRAVMEEPEPVLAYGGTTDTLARLPHMQWQKIAEARAFDLPVSRDLLAAAAARRLHLPVALGRITAGIVAKHRYGSRRFKAPDRVEPFAAATLGPEVLALYGGDPETGLRQVPDLEFMRWLTTGYSGTGHFLVLYFHDPQRLRGWSLSRVWRSRQGIVATIVDLFWPRADVATLSWMVGETVSSLLSFRPLRVTTTATSPVLQEALRRNRFRVTDTVAVHFWGKGRELGCGPIELTHNYADWPILPYPAESVGTRFLVGEG